MKLKSGQNANKCVENGENIISGNITCDKARKKCPNRVKENNNKEDYKVKHKGETGQSGYE